MKMANNFKTEFLTACIVFLLCFQVSSKVMAFHIYFSKSKQILPNESILVQANALKHNNLVASFSEILQDLTPQNISQMNTNKMVENVYFDFSQNASLSSIANENSHYTQLLKGLFKRLDQISQFNKNDLKTYNFADQFEKTKNYNHIFKMSSSNSTSNLNVGKAEEVTSVKTHETIFLKKHEQGNITVIDESNNNIETLKSVIEDNHGKKDIHKILNVKSNENYEKTDKSPNNNLVEESLQMTIKEENNASDVKDNDRQNVTKDEATKKFAKLEHFNKSDESVLVLSPQVDYQRRAIHPKLKPLNTKHSQIMSNPDYNVSNEKNPQETHNIQGPTETIDESENKIQTKVDSIRLLEAFTINNKDYLSQEQTYLLFQFGHDAQPPVVQCPNIDATISISCFSHFARVLISSNEPNTMFAYVKNDEENKIFLFDKTQEVYLYWKGQSNLQKMFMVSSLSFADLNKKCNSCSFETSLVLKKDDLSCQIPVKCEDETHGQKSLILRQDVLNDKEKQGFATVTLNIEEHRDTNSSSFITPQEYVKSIFNLNVTVVVSSLDMTVAADVAECSILLPDRSIVIIKQGCAVTGFLRNFKESEEFQYTDIFETESTVILKNSLNLKQFVYAGDNEKVVFRLHCTVLICRSVCSFPSCTHRSQNDPIDTDDAHDIELVTLSKTVVLNKVLLIREDRDMQTLLFSRLCIVTFLFTMTLTLQVIYQTRWRLRPQPGNAVGAPWDEDEEKGDFYNTYTCPPRRRSPMSYNSKDFCLNF